MRTAGALLALAALAAGCMGTASDAPAAAASRPGCGVLPQRLVVGLLGTHVEVALHGAIDALREQHLPLTCTTGVHGDPARYVTVRAVYHPGPVRLPSKACQAGWVYAGTPDKYAPACQEAVRGHARTELVVRWQPYVVHVDVGRSDRSWAGDPEVALAMSRDLARRLGVREASGNG